MGDHIGILWQKFQWVMGGPKMCLFLSGNVSLVFKIFYQTFFPTPNCSLVTKFILGVDLCLH